MKINVIAYLGDVLSRMELSGQMWGLLVFLVFMRSVDCLSSITESRRQAQSVSLTLTCKDNGPITGDVIFFQDSSLRGACSPNCGTGITGYAVSQNTTARETYLTISSLEEPRDCGSWSCGQGAVADSAPLMIQCPIPCLINPSTDITVTPPVSSLTSADNISVQVSVPCCSRNAVIKWTYQKQNESPVLLASSTTTPGGSCPAGEKQTLNTFQPHQTAFLTPGEVNLTLTIEHDSFDPPDYTVVFTTLIDVRETTTTTLPASPTTTNNTSAAPVPVPEACGFALIAVIILVVLLVMKIATDVIFVGYRWGDRFGVKYKQICKQIIDTDKRKYILYWICFVQGIINSICGVTFFIVIFATCSESLGEGLPIAVIVIGIIGGSIGVINIVMCLCCCCCPKSSDPGKSDDPSPWLCCCCLGTIHPEEKRTPAPSSLQPIRPSMASPRKPVPPSSTTARTLPSPTSEPASDPKVLEPLSVEEPKKKKKKRKKRKKIKEAGGETSDQPMNPAGDSDE